MRTPKRRNWKLQATSHSPALLHHFDTAEQQKDASTLGMWLFLVTEIMFFGGMFTGLHRVPHPASRHAFVEASHELDITMGAINTAVLICSSLTMVLAVDAASKGSRKNTVLFLILTILLGAVFLGIKAVEYHEKFVNHHVPGPSFHFEGPDAANAQLFFSLYFAMTGLHALHMVIGMVLLAILAVRAQAGRFAKDYYTPIDMTGLYWHFVDIVWIFCSRCCICWAGIWAEGISDVRARHVEENLLRDFRGAAGVDLSDGRGGADRPGPVQYDRRADDRGHESRAGGALLHACPLQHAADEAGGGGRICLAGAADWIDDGGYRDSRLDPDSELIGGPRGDRTPDLCIANAALSQLS